MLLPFPVSCAFLRGKLSEPVAKRPAGDSGASDNTKKRMRDSCAYSGVRLAETAAGRLGEAVGRPGRMSAAVAKGTLGDKLASLAAQEGA